MQISAEVSQSNSPDRIQGNSSSHVQSQTYLKLLDDSVRDSAKFVSTVKEHFSRIDIDGSNTLSRIEVEQYATKTGVDAPEKSVASLLLNGFDSFKEMAGSRRPDEYHSGTAGGFMYDRLFGLENDGIGDTISQRDFQSLEVVISRQSIAVKLEELRKSEIKQGAVFLGAGTLVGGLTGYGTFVAIGTAAAGFVGLATIPMAMALLVGGLGVWVGRHGLSELRNSNVESIKMEADKRRKMLESAGLILK